MAMRLVSDWVVIGTAGFTVDNREISAISLEQAAKNYSKKEYTAVINAEHFYGNFGVVDELRTGKDEKDRVTLEARIAPNTTFIQNRKDYENRRFFSMELQPNFCNTGEYYLIGLAITDTPASVGIEEFCKSQTAVKYKGNHMGILQFSEQEDEKTFFTMFKNFFNKTEKLSNKNNKENEEEKMSEKNPTLEAFNASIEKATTTIEKLSATATKKDEESKDLFAKFSALEAAKKIIDEKLTKLAGIEEKYTALVVEKKLVDDELAKFKMEPHNQTKTPTADGGEDLVIC